MSSPAERRCSRCPKKYPPEFFPLSINGTKRLKYCRDCQIKVTALNLANAKKLKISKNYIPLATRTRRPGKHLTRQESSLDAFLKEIQALCRTKKPISLDCFVDISPLALNTAVHPKESADQLRNCIQEALPWRFTLCVNTYHLGQWHID